MNKPDTPLVYTARHRLMMLGFVAVSGLLGWRAFHLQILNQDFLRHHGDARSLRVVKIPAHRGMITDRNDEPLAISTPVDTIWAIPRQVLENPRRLPALARVLDLDPGALTQILEERIGREFVYLKRHVSPDQARAVNDLEMYGVYQQQEFRRYYPAGEVAAHLVGFTNVDDRGQEGLELAYDDWLEGTPGAKRVLKDRLGRVIRDVESIQPASPGRPLALSIDRRVQYLAYRELAAAVRYNHARSGSLVMLKADTGEVIALAVQPSYNPNNRAGLKSDHFRNRAATDVFEPGSTLKPFTIAAALQSGLYQAGSVIRTGPGYLRVSNHVINDVSNYGDLDLTGIIQKSSNVGAGKIGLSLGPERLWQMYRDVGLGETTGSGFPGESPGLVSPYNNWTELDLASISFGHGLAVTALQLAQAYAVLASGGILRPVTFVKAQDEVAGRRVLSEEITLQVRGMLEQAVTASGTGERANIPLYRVAGKTGTAHKSTSEGYAEDRYLSLFAGLAPASDPQLVLVVMIDEPQGGAHYGGQVAAPVFARVMQGAVRILDIPPDDLPAAGEGLLMAGRHRASGDQVR